jgi:hypothetical protein
MRFRRNPAFHEEIEATPEFKKGEAKITVGVAESIQAAAEPFRDTGNYIGRVHARGTRVETERHFSHIIELGSVNNPPQRNILRGVTAAGLRFEDDRAALS